MNLENLVVDGCEDVSSSNVERAFHSAKHIQHLIYLNDNRMLEDEDMKQAIFNSADNIVNDLEGELALMQVDNILYSENRSHIPEHAHYILDLIDKQFNGAVDEYEAGKDDWVRVEHEDGTVEWKLRSDESTLEDEHFWNPANWTVVREKEIRV